MPLILFGQFQLTKTTLKISNNRPSEIETYKGQFSRYQIISFQTSKKRTTFLQRTQQLNLYRSQCVINFVSRLHCILLQTKYHVLQCNCRTQCTTQSLLSTGYIKSDIQPVWLSGWYLLYTKCILKKSSHYQSQVRCKMNSSCRSLLLP